MPYSEAVLRRARERLSDRRQEWERENETRIRRIYDDQPRLEEIDRRLRSTAAQVMAAAFRRGEDPAEAIACIRAENLALQQERARLMAAAGISEADLKNEPLCPRCGGSGYVGERMCECLRELCCQEQTRVLTSLLAGSGSFEAFRLDLYPDRINPRLGTSPRKTMEIVFNRCLRYANSFSTSAPSLLFSGGPGLGKTFLSAAIARTVAGRGYSVAYETTNQVLSDFEREKFGGERDLTEKYLNCDLLILDDLGTEMTNQFTLSALYALLNSRLLAGLPMVASTNLTTDEIRQRYTPQITSRLLGTCELLLFFGDDLRMRKR